MELFGVVAQNVLHGDKSCSTAPWYLPVMPVAAKTGKNYQDFFAVFEKIVENVKKKSCRFPRKRVNYFE